MLAKCWQFYKGKILTAHIQAVKIPLGAPERTILKKPRFAVCFQISIVTHKLKILLSIILVKFKK